ncbi:MAG: translation initiation factor IF-3 [Nitratireductor sp.]
MRRPHRAQAPVKEGPRSNEDIRSPKVQLIDAEGQNLGVMETAQAMALAAEAGFDLVEIAANNDPPICKILDLGRFKYQAQKKAAEQRKKQKTQEVKEIKMRPNIDTHDYDVKMRQVKKFLEEGDKVKLTMRFRGREMAHQELGLEVLIKVREEIGDISKVESEPKLEGRQMMMVVSPR